MNGLNDPQRQAVRYLNGPLLVLAGAGSGKTRVITEKIAYLVRDCGYRPRQIAAVTFTNKAAREMKQRASKLLPGKQGAGLRVSTFHTLGLAIIRQELAALGRRPGFSIFDARDGLQLLQELTRDDRDAAEAQQTLWRISRWKSDSITPEQALQDAASAADAAAARAYRAYCDQLEAYNAVDFDDLIGLPLRLFQQRPEVVEAWRQRLRYLLVDEYQDTNACQYQLVRLLVGERSAFTVVGDDDQSIYAWRGAQPENLETLQRDFPQLRVIKLEQNYRSAQRILRSANRLIAKNPHVFTKKLWSDLGRGDPIRVLSCKDGDDEAERVVLELINHRLRYDGGYRDYAILYRSNHQARPFEQRLREHRVPYRLSGGNSFFDHVEVKDVLAYLRLLVNPNDDAAFLRIVNVPRREIGPATLQKLAGYAARRRLCLLHACSEVGLATELSDRALQRLQQFAAQIGRYAERVAGDDPAALARELVQSLRYQDWLKSLSNDPRSAQRRMQNVDELLDWLARTPTDDDAGLAERIAKLALIDMLERSDDGQDQDAVTLMTLHTAKGLEFPHVFLTGLEDELLPHRNSVADGGIEEERRLMYVGITRAQRSLTLTLARRRKRYGEWQPCEPSRFLAELPDDELVWEGVGQPALPAEQREERGRAHLALLKGLLKTP